MWHGWQSKFNRLNQLCLAHKLGSDSALIIYTSGTTGPPKGMGCFFITVCIVYTYITSFCYCVLLAKLQNEYHIMAMSKEN